MKTEMPLLKRHQWVGLELARNALGLDLTSDMPKWLSELHAHTYPSSKGFCNQPHAAKSLGKVGQNFAPLF